VFSSRDFLRGAGAAFVIIAVATTAVATGCSDGDTVLGPGPLDPVVGGGEDDGIPGSGSIISETREVGSFDRIRFVSEGTVTVRFAAAESVMIEGDDNLMQYLETTVEAGTLVVETSESVDIAPTQPPQFTISAVDLVGIEFVGAGTLTADATAARTFDLAFVGVGELAIDDLTVDELRLTLDGVGTVRLGGTATKQVANVDGVAEYDGGDLATTSTELEVGGSTSTLVWATDELLVTGSGLAEVRYYGDPAVEADLIDSAIVTSLGSR
jgi:hypothetical protein